MHHHIHHLPASQDISVLLIRSELIYDVNFATNRTARLSHVDQEGKLLKTASSAQTDDERNDDYIDRLFTSAIAKIKSSTSWASKMRGGRCVTNEIPEDADHWTFIFTLPLDWRGDASVLSSLLHDYLVQYVLADWFNLTNAIQANAYTQKADFTLSEIKCELRKQAPHPPIPTSLY